MKRRYIKPETEVFSAVWLEPMMQAATTQSDETGTTDEGFDAEGRETFLEPETEETPGIYKRNLWED
ncbi:MAG: hypothetical protein II854_07060 [Prevotella sp.]|nr:hypothetical protein [Prevotella sp.]